MATTVKFGDADATAVTYNSDTEIVATTPAGVAGSVDVVVTTTGGSDTLTAGFEYTDAERGPEIMATTVTIGGADATDVQVASATSLTAVVPAGTGGDTVDVVVTTSTDSVTLTDGYSYDVPAPMLTDVIPDVVYTGAVTKLTLIGTGFSTASNQYRLRFWTGTAYTSRMSAVTRGTETQMTTNAVTQVADSFPAVGTSLEARLVEYGSTSTVVSALPDAVTVAALDAPTVSDITPLTGPATGTDVTITGSGFNPDVLWSLVAVIDGTAVAYFPCTWVSETEMTARISGAGDRTMQLWIAAGSGANAQTNYVSTDSGLTFVQTDASMLDE